MKKLSDTLSSLAYSFLQFSRLYVSTKLIAGISRGAAKPAQRTGESGKKVVVNTPTQVWTSPVNGVTVRVYKPGVEE